MTRHGAITLASLAFDAMEHEDGPPAKDAPAASDLGWKDTVLVWPGETVCIVIDFSHTFYGNQVYMIHCHNLGHEDQSMMLNLRIEG